MLSYVEFPEFISATILLFIGVGISFVIWFIAKKILEYLKIDKKIEFRFLSKKIPIAFWVPVFLAMPFIISFLSESVNILVPEISLFYYLVSYYISVVKILFWIVLISTLYHRFRKKYKTKAKKK